MCDELNQIVMLAELCEHEFCLNLNLKLSLSLFILAFVVFIMNPFMLIKY